MMTVPGLGPNGEVPPLRAVPLLEASSPASTAAPAAAPPIKALSQNN